MAAVVDEIVSRANEVVAAWELHPRSAAARREVAEAIDRLLGLLLRHGIRIPNDLEVHELFAATQPDGRLKFPDGLRSLEPHLVQIAVMRELMRRRGIDFDPERVPNWQRFIDKYGAVILAGIAVGEPFSSRLRLSIECS